MTNLELMFNFEVSIEGSLGGLKKNSKNINFDKVWDCPVDVWEMTSKRPFQYGALIICHSGPKSEIRFFVDHLRDFSPS